MDEQVTDPGQPSYNNGLHIEGVQLVPSTDRMWEVALSIVHMATCWLSGPSYVTQVAAHYKVNTDEWASICSRHCSSQGCNDAAAITAGEQVAKHSRGPGRPKKCTAAETIPGLQK